MPKTVTLESFCNQCDEVTVHPNRAEALEWVKKSSPNGSNDSSTFLVFYKNKYGNVRALLPFNKTAEVNAKLRVVGARNNWEEPLLQQCSDIFYSHKVPRLAQLVGGEIIPDAPHGILIVYKKRETESRWIFLQDYR